MAQIAQEDQNKSKSKGIVREYAEAIIIAVILALFIRAFVVQAFKIPSGSMKTTLLVGDHILVNKFIYGIKLPVVDRDLVRFGNPNHGDVIVFRYPLDTSKDFIKRVIGLPGDTIQIQDKQVFRNGQLMQEPHARHTDPRILSAGVSPRDNFGPIVVPEHAVFVMGDNRDESYDSRFWKFVDRSAVLGKAFVIYWSWNQDGEVTLDPEQAYVRWDRIGDFIH